MKKLIYLAAAAVMASAGIASAQQGGAMNDLQPAAGKAAYNAAQSGSVAVQAADLNGDGMVDRVLPTVNKVEGGVEVNVKVTTSGKSVQAPRDSATGKATGKAMVNFHADGWGASTSAARLQDFEKNTEAKADEDENISSVDVAADHVDVGYQHSAKLFGFLPVTMNIHAVVDKDGNLKTQKPWWSFLTTSEADAFTAAVQAEFKAEQSALKTFSIQDLLQRQAQYFQSLTNILKTRHDVEASATSTAEVK